MVCKRFERLAVMNVRVFFMSKFEGLEIFRIAQR